MCAAPTNFLQWNPGQINQEADASYSADAQRTGGAVSGIFPSELANKLFYQVSTFVAALATALVNKGYEMQDTDLSTLITAMANILTKADFGTGAGTVCQGNDARLDVEIASGSKVWFWQATAPTGWTIDTSAADAVLAVKGGLSSYGVDGGLQAGTWTQLKHTHTTGDHVLTEAEMPAHSHTYQREYDSLGSSGGLVKGYYLGTYNTSTVGSSQAHNHGATGNGAPANTWRPLAQVGIICTKN
jgi:hypothetical protein